MMPSPFLTIPETRTFPLPPPPSFTANKTRSASFFRTLFRNHFCLLSRESLPPRDRDVDEAGFKFDRVASSPKLLGCDELRSAPAEWLKAEVARFRVQFHRNRKEFVGLRSWVIAALHLGARNLPDRAWVAIAVIDERLLALNPAEEARLVRPHINRVGQDGPAFEPDDLLMMERADLVPDPFEHRLPCGRVPAIPGCVGCDRAFDRGFVKGEIERSPTITAAVLVVKGSSAGFVVDSRPVLIAVGFGPVRPGGRMRAASVPDRIRRVSREQNRPFIAHQA